MGTTIFRVAPALSTGTDISGTEALANQNNGVNIYGAVGNTVGGTSAALDSRLPVAVGVQ